MSFVLAALRVLYVVCVFVLVTILIRGLVRTVKGARRFYLLSNGLVVNGNGRVIGEAVK